MVNPGQRIGEYVLQRPLGAGTFGQVWLACHHAWSDQFVAVKIPTEPAYIRNLQREGMALPQLHHPAIVAARNFDPYADPPYLVMEYVPGTSLRPLIENKMLSPDDAIAILKQILQGMSHAHAKGVIHRDLKPENILIHAKAASVKYAARGAVKITDFGLGRAANLANKESMAFSTSMAKSDAARIVGTLDYMAPEQRDGDEIDGRADLYACGVILFEMLTGQHPVGRELPSELNPASPKYLDDVFARAWSRRERRYASADEFLAALETPVPAVAPTPPPLPRKKPTPAPPSPNYQHEIATNRKALEKALDDISPAPPPSPNYQYPPPHTPESQDVEALVAPQAPLATPPVVFDWASYLAKIVAQLKLLWNNGGQVPWKDRRIVWVGLGIGAVIIAAVLLAWGLFGSAPGPDVVKVPNVDTAAATAFQNSEARKAGLNPNVPLAIADGAVMTNGQLPSGINVGTPNPKEKDGMTDWGSFSLEEGKFVDIELTAVKTVQLMAKGANPVNVLGAPQGKRAIIVWTRTREDLPDKWVWANNLNDFAYADGANTRHPLAGVIVKLKNANGQDMLNIAYNSTKQGPVKYAPDKDALQMRPSDVGLIFVVPQGAQMTNLMFKTEVAKSLPVTVN